MLSSVAVAYRHKPTSLRAGLSRRSTPSVAFLRHQAQFSTLVFSRQLLLNSNLSHPNWQISSRAFASAASNKDKKDQPKKLKTQEAAEQKKLKAKEAAEQKKIKAQEEAEKKKLKAKEAAEKKKLKALQLKEKEREAKEKAKAKAKAKAEKEKERELKLREKEKARLKKQKEKEKAELAKQARKKKLEEAKAKKEAKPARARPAYSFYIKDNFAEVSASLTGASTIDVMKELGARWKGLSDQQKQTYFSLAAEDLERATREREAYNASRPKRAPSSYLLFVKEHIETVAGSSAPEKMVAIGKMWNALSDSEKKKYVTEAERLKKELEAKQ